MNDQSHRPRPLWPAWVMLIIFIFLAFECTLLAVTLKGSWFVLLAPGIVCGMKAVDMWRDLRRRLEHDGSDT